MKRIVTTLLVVLIASFVVAPVAGQSTEAPAGNRTENSTGPASGPGDYDLVIDNDTAITDWSYEDGRFEIDVYSDEYKTLTVSASPGGSSRQGSISFRSVVLEEDAVTTVSISSPTGVTMWTEDSVAEGRAHYLRAPSGALISGPWSGSDVRDAAIGGALGVLIAVLYEAVSAKSGASKRGERVA